MLEAVVWGLVQGLTEFLPISSDGHLVLVPAFLGLEQPDLATTAVLHLGTLVAVIAYFRRDLLGLVRARTDPQAGRLLGLLILGSLPAGLAIFFVEEVETLQRSVAAAAIFLMLTGAVMLVADQFRPGDRRIPDARPLDALLIGFAQLLAILPGVSRSGMTISVALGREFGRVEAARFSFLLGIPAITAAGLLELWTLADRGGVPPTAWVGVLIAGVTGYLAIAFLLRMLARSGLTAYAVYCLVVGALALVVL